MKVVLLWANMCCMQNEMLDVCFNWTAQRNAHIGTGSLKNLYVVICIVLIKSEKHITMVIYLHSTATED